MKRAASPPDSLISARIRRVRKPPRPAGMPPLRRPRLRLTTCEQETVAAQLSPAPDAPGPTGTGRPSPQEAAHQIRNWLCRMETILVELRGAHAPDGRELRLLQCSLDAGLAAIRALASCDPSLADWLAASASCDKPTNDSPRPDDTPARTPVAASIQATETIIYALHRHLEAVAARRPDGPAASATIQEQVLNENTAACLAAAHDSDFASEIGRLTRMDVLCQTLAASQRSSPQPIGRQLRIRPPADHDGSR